MRSDFQERIEKLSGQQKLLLAKHIGVGKKGKSNGEGSSNQSIAAYFVADEEIGTTELRERLKDKLPEYMIPSKFIQLDELPKLPNGKVDVSLLKLPVEDAAKPAVSVAQTETESQLVTIWEEVLGFHPIGVQDNFFEIGGDSILSIQIVAKARKKGIFLAPNQIFEHQTISELALFAKTENKKTTEETIAGTVPLLPIQHWFFKEHKNAPHYWNQAIQFDVPENLNPDLIKKSIEYLVKHHDALRLGFEKTKDSWNAFIADPVAINAFHSIDLTASSSLQIEAAIEQKSVELQENLDLSKAGLFQAHFFICGRGMKNKMLLIAHHLVTDAVSWQLLVSDLESICLQLSRGEEIELTSTTTSYRQWAAHVAELAASVQFDDEIEFWKEQNSLGRFPVDVEAQLPIQEESTHTITLKIDAATTENLLKNSNEAYNTKTEELLITALMLGIEKWGNISSLCLGLERHGRKYSKLDLSDIVGWFTTYFPVALNIEDGTNFKSSIISIKEKLRSIPSEGIGYGVLRYLKNADGFTQKPSVIFNFLGNQKPFDSGVLGKARSVSKGVRSPRSERYHLLEINAFIEEKQLILNFTYSQRFHQAETMEKLTEVFENCLRQLVEHCVIRETSEYSPSDFPEADLNQDDLDNLLNQLN